MKKLLLVMIVKTILTSQKIFELYYNFGNENYRIPFGLEGKKSTYNIEIGLNKNFTLVPHLYNLTEKFYPKSISAGTNLLNPFEKETLEVAEINHQLKFPLMESLKVNLSFFSVYKSNKYKVSNYYGFGLRFKDKKFSIVHSFYKEGLIDKLGFGIVPPLHSNLYSGKLVMGKFSKELIQGKSHAKCHCDPNSSLIGWNCMLNKISIGNHIFNKKYDVLFTSSLYDIFVPDDFFSFLEKNIMNPFIEKGLCDKITSGPFHFFRCIFFDIEVRKIKLTFEIENSLYVLDFTNLFACGEYICDLVIKRTEEKLFLLGNSFMGKFYVYFDYDDESVEFYSVSDKIPSIKDPIKKTLLIVNICLISLVTIFNLIFFISLNHCKVSSNLLK